jgi:hypothetical protein
LEDLIDDDIVVALKLSLLASNIKRKYIWGLRWFSFILQEI